LGRSFEESTECIEGVGISDNPADIIGGVSLATPLGRFRVAEAGSFFDNCRGYARGVVPYGVPD